MLHQTCLTLIASLGCAVSILHAASPVAVPTVSPLTDPNRKTTGLILIAENNTTAQAILDGSSSSDADGDPLSFSWSVVGGPAFSSSATLTNTFNVGLWGIALSVSDGTSTSTAHVAIQVETPCQALEKMKSDISAEPGMPRHEEKRLHTILNAACRAFDKGHTRQGDRHLEHFKKAVKRVIGNRFPFFTEDLIESAQFILDRSRS